MHDIGLSSFPKIILDLAGIKLFPTFGWWAINILIPIVGPLFFLWLIGQPPATAPLASNNVIKSIGKGELLWAVMGMAASTCSDLVDLLDVPAAAAWKQAIWLAFSLHIVLIVVSVVVVAMNSLDLPTGYTPSNPHIPDKRIFAMSIVALGVVVATYSAAHATLTDQQEKDEKIKRETAWKTVAERTAAEKKAIIDSIATCLARAQGDGAHCLKGLK